MTALEEAQAWLDDKTVEIWWGRDSALTDEQVRALLAGGDAWQNAQAEIYESVLYGIWEAEQGWRERAAKEFDVDIEKLDTSAMKLDMNLGDLVRNTRVYLGLGLGIRHEYVYYTVRSTYEDRAEELEQLGVNPHDMDEEWPDMPERNDPLINPDDLKELWINHSYGGEYVALLDSGAVLRAALKGDLDEYAILKAGATVTIHDFSVGASSVLASTQRDVEIDPDEIYNDGAYRYGVQATCGLVVQAWDSELAKPEDVSR